MKKILSLIFVFSMVLTAFGGIVSNASDVPTFTVAEVSAFAGDTDVIVEVTTSNNTGVTGMVLYAEYDDELFTLKEVVNGEVLSGLNYQRPKTYKDGCTLLWYGSEPDEIIDGEAFTMIFNIAETVTPGTYPVNLIYSTGTDVDLNDITFTVVNGSITIPFSEMSDESSKEPSSEENSEPSNNGTNVENDGNNNVSYNDNVTNTDDEKEEIKSGWVKENNKWYYYADGIVKKGWLKDNNVWYYLDAKTGVMKTGWVKDGNTWYFLKGSGAMATGWIKSGNYWYFLKSSGSMATGWIWDNNWYYLKSDGAMKTGWLEDNSKWYYLNNSGAMMTNTIIDGYRIDGNGVWVK